jgi:hypothetical protein
VPVVALAAVLAALCGNKVLSPQHLLWILPLVALSLVGRAVLPRIGAVLLLAAMVLTQVEFPAMYFRQIRLEATPLLVICARNVLLAAAFVVTVVAVWRLRREDESVAAASADTVAHADRQHGFGPEAIEREAETVSEVRPRQQSSSGGCGPACTDPLLGCSTRGARPH